MSKMKLLGVVVGGGLALVTGLGVASAQELEETVADLASALDIAWLLIAGILVLFMQGLVWLRRRSSAPRT